MPSVDYWTTDLVPYHKKYGLRRPTVWVQLAADGYTTDKSLDCITVIKGRDRVRWRLSIYFHLFFRHPPVRCLRWVSSLLYRCGNTINRLVLVFLRHPRCHLSDGCDAEWYVCCVLGWELTISIPIKWKQLDSFQRVNCVGTIMVRERSGALMIYSSPHVKGTYCIRYLVQLKSGPLR